MKRILLWIWIILCLAGCRKYALQKDFPSPAYIRVFNDIQNNFNILSAQQNIESVAFIMDPTFDSVHHPQNGYIVGDFLAPRQLFTLSYPTDAANTVVGSGTVNYEYPGRAHVLTAPSINGFDCSSWAEIPSGNHRILFVARQASGTAFDSLSSAQRSAVLVDTTIDFQPGQLYTIEAVLQNADLATYGAYVRNEDFSRNSYASDSIYLSFYNLSASLSAADTSNYLSQYENWFTYNVTIAGTYYAYDPAFNGFDSVPGFSTLSAGLGQHFSQHGPQISLPILPTSDFFDDQGNLLQYGLNNTNTPLSSGALPYLLLTFYSLYQNIEQGQFTSQLFSVNFSSSPVNFNDYSTGQRDYFGYLDLPNVNLISNVSGSYKVYPALNIIEIINNKVYMMQVQKLFPLINSR